MFLLKQNFSLDLLTIVGLLEQEIFLPHSLLHSIVENVLYSFESGSASYMLFHGPSGTGKTFLSSTLVRVLRQFDFESVFEHDATQFKSAESGDTERKLEEAFERAAFQAPSLLIIENVEVLAAVRSYRGASVSDLSTLDQLLCCLDAHCHSALCVIATTSELDCIDERVLRSGRLCSVYEFPVLSERLRARLIEKHLSMAQGFCLSNCDLKPIRSLLVERCAGFSAVDVQSIFQCALATATSRSSPHKPMLTFADIKEALVATRPSLLAGLDVRTPKIKFEHLAAVGDIVDQLFTFVLQPLRDRSGFLKFGIAPPRGVLLYGPSGCGKTHLVEAIASEANANFVHIYASSLLSKYLGESERNLARLFRQARACAPCILFIDHIESIARKRGFDSSTAQSADRLLSCLLTEMDGFSTSNQDDVMILGATNRIEMLDEAILRPGRFDVQIAVPLPKSSEERAAILRCILKQMRAVDVKIDIQKVAERTDGWSGSDLYHYCRQIALKSVNDAERRQHESE